MGSICLFKADKFLLGLDNSRIESILSTDKLKAEKSINENFVFLHLESFFKQKKLELSGAEIIVIKHSSENTALLYMMWRSRSAKGPPAASGS